MKNFKAAACVAIALSVVCEPLLAKELNPSDHAPAGVMFDHAHHSGEWMFGIRYSDEVFSGMRQGSDLISDHELGELGYHMRASRMSMHMAMFDIMYAPTDRLTLMVMPQYMRMNMAMVDLESSHHEGDDSDGHMHGMGGHMHHVSGWGDTQLSGIWRLNTDHDNQWLLATTFSAPTGQVDIRNPDGAFTHYGMQLGSGTWDFLPSLTYVRRREVLDFGAQLGAIYRLEDENESGYRLGNGWNGSLWVSASPDPRLSVSARLVYKKQGEIEGHYNAAHNHSAPEDLQGNYGGRTLDLGFGVNAILHGVRLGVEWIEPIEQKLNGEQLGKKRGLVFSISRSW